jgi:chromosome partitioning protein
MSDKIISIVNQKGGVGKTTTAINICSILANKYKKKVLLIDMDPQGNASSGLGLKKEDYINKNIYQVLIQKEDIKNTIKQINEFLSICPAETNLSGAEIELMNSIAREYRLKNALEPIKNDYDYIIIDCAPSLGLLTVNALTATESCIVTIQAEYFSIEGVAHLKNTINLIKQYINNNLKIKGILLTMIDNRNKLHSQIEAAIREHFTEALKTTIPRNIKIAEASSFGKSVSEYNKNSSGASAYDKLVEELFPELVKKEL